MRVQRVVVDSHVQRIKLAAEETKVTQQVSHRPIKYQFRLCSQRGAKVNGSHRGDNPLLRPTEIQIATKIMRLCKQWHLSISKSFAKPPYSVSRPASIDSDCCRLPTTSVLSNKAVGCISRGRARPYTRREDPPILIPLNQVLEREGTRIMSSVSDNSFVWAGC